MYIPKKLLLCILLFIISICFIISNFSINYKEGLFTIETGETLKTISCNLKDNGFIKSSHLFYIQLYLKDNPNHRIISTIYRNNRLNILTTKNNLALRMAKIIKKSFNGTMKVIFSKKEALLRVYVVL
jgi:cell division protein YceG involved in septum cleavage